MDAILLSGGWPANFLDVGGGATVEKVTEAFKLMLRNPQLKAILVNIFGGIARCDVIAQGIVAALGQVKLHVPLVVRMKGTNEELGWKILAQSDFPIIAADNMIDAADKVVAAAQNANATIDLVMSGEGIPTYGSVKEAATHTGATVPVTCAPSPFAAAAIDEGVDGEMGKLLKSVP
ncbi:MAG: hypothetical protein ACHQIO_09850, partial [Nevskiales bacterium]